MISISFHSLPKFEETAFTLVTVTIFGRKCAGTFRLRRGATSCTPHQNLKDDPAVVEPIVRRIADFFIVSSSHQGSVNSPALHAAVFVKWELGQTLITQ